MKCWLALLLQRRAQSLTAQTLAEPAVSEAMLTSLLLLFVAPAGKITGCAAKKLKVLLRTAVVSYPSLKALTRRMPFTLLLRSVQMALVSSGVLPSVVKRMTAFEVIVAILISASLMNVPPSRLITRG